MELRTIGLTKKFGSKTAVDDLNITLTNGIYGLLVANSAGKTTLMRLLCNIQKPINITCGTLLKNQIVAFGASMALFLFSVLLPITEVNPLFRVAGLLPIYHVLARVCKAQGIISHM